MLERPGVGLDAGGVHARPCGRRRCDRRRAGTGSGARLQISSTRCAVSVSSAQPLGLDALVAELELQGRQDRDQVRVAGPLPVAVHRPLDERRARRGRRRASWRRRTRRRCGCGCRRWRDASAERGDDRRGRLRDLVREGWSRWCRRGSRSRRRPRPPRAGRRARSRGRRASRRRSARRRRSPACRRSAQKRTESAIIARFSSRETRVTFSRCSAQVLPTSVTTGAKQPARAARPGIVRRRRGRAAGSCRTRRPSPARAARTGEQLEQLQLLRVRVRESGLDQLDAERGRAPRPPAPSRGPTATCPGPACRRAASCRKAEPCSRESNLLPDR